MVEGARTFGEIDGMGVLTGDLCNLSGGCTRCLGTMSAEACDHSEDDNPDELVFCTHWCHKVGSSIM